METDAKLNSHVKHKRTTAKSRSKPTASNVKVTVQRGSPHVVAVHVPTTVTTDEKASKADYGPIPDEHIPADPEARVLCDEFEKLCTIQRQLAYSTQLVTECNKKRAVNYQVQLYGSCVLHYSLWWCLQRQLHAGLAIVQELQEGQLRRRKQQARESILQTIDHNINVLVRKLPAILHTLRGWANPIPRSNK